MKHKEKRTSEIFRSINFIHEGNRIFEFQDTFPEVLWTTDPWSRRNLYSEFFEKQLQFKKNALKGSASGAVFNGRILVAEVDNTLRDGASEVESKGLIDINDCPPIDTWFYCANDAQLGLLVFAWIPDEYYELVNDAVLVNCVDMMHWMDTPEIEKYNLQEVIKLNSNFNENVKSATVSFQDIEIHFSKKMKMVLYFTFGLSLLQSVLNHLFTSDYAHKIFSLYFLLETLLLYFVITAKKEFYNKFGFAWLMASLAFTSFFEAYIFIIDKPISPDELLMMLVFSIRVWVIYRFVKFIYWK